MHFINTCGLDQFNLKITQLSILVILGLEAHASWINVGAELLESSSVNTLSTGTEEKHVWREYLSLQGLGWILMKKYDGSVPSILSVQTHNVAGNYICAGGLVFICSLILHILYVVRCNFPLFFKKIFSVLMMNLE